MDTAGRAVLFAGATVILALLGQLLLGVGLLDGLARRLRAGRPRHDAGRTDRSAGPALPIRRAGWTPLTATVTPAHARAPRRPERWLRWSHAIARHPWRGVIAGLAIMLTLAVPALSLRAGTSDAGNDAANLTTRHAYDLVARGFGAGANGPLSVGRQSARRPGRAALTAVTDALRTTGDIASVSPAQHQSEPATTAVLDAYPRSSPQSAATTDLVNHLRDDVLPRVQRSTGDDDPRRRSERIGDRLQPRAVKQTAAIHRGRADPVGDPARDRVQVADHPRAGRGDEPPVNRRLARRDRRRLPMGVAGQRRSGVTPGPIEAFIPEILFAIVFGLSMDYEVFIISRIHEEWLRRRDATRRHPPRHEHHGTADHGGGHDHDLRLRVVRARGQPRRQAVRDQPGQRRVSSTRSSCAASCSPRSSSSSGPAPGGCPAGCAGAPRASRSMPRTPRSPQHWKNDDRATIPNPLQRPRRREAGARNPSAGLMRRPLKATWRRRASLTQRTRPRLRRWSTSARTPPDGHDSRSASMSPSALWPQSRRHRRIGEPRPAHSPFGSLGAPSALQPGPALLKPGLCSSGVRHGGLPAPDCGCALRALR